MATTTRVRYVGTSPPHQRRIGAVRGRRQPRTPALPPAPGGIQTSTSTSSVDISWNAVIGATLYKVYRSTVPAGPFTLLGSTAATHFSDLTITTGVAYYYTVSAVTANGESPQASAGGATVNIPPSVINVTPPPGTPILPTTPLSFDLVVPDGLRRAIILATIGGQQEVIYDGTAFDTRYVAGSQRSVIPGGYHFVVFRNGGWPSPPTIVPYVIDLAGLEN